MDRSKFERHLEHLREQIQELSQNHLTGQTDPHEGFEKALQELSDTVEELQVAEEDLHAQNEQFAAAFIAQVETRVKERTHALNQANQQLTLELEAEREQLLLENRLQKELLQGQSQVDPGGQALVWGKDLIFQYVNPAYRALTPHPEIDPLGQPYDTIWPPADFHSHRKLIEQVLESGNDVHMQHHARPHPDGTTRYYTFHINYIDFKGQPAASIVLWDTTELVEIEHRLEASETRYRQLVELSPDAIFIQSGGRFAFVNSAMLRLLGAERPEQLLGERVLDHVHPAYRAGAAERIRTLNEERREAPELEEVFLGLDGSAVDVEAVGAPTLYEGQPAALVIARDITRRKTAERRVTAEQEWFRTTLSSIGDAVITADAQGRVSFLNPVAEALTGWKNSAAAGLPMEQVFHIINEQTLLPAENPVGRVLREGVTLGLANHTALVRPDGRILPIEDSAAPIQDAHGQTFGVVIVFHDVSEKRKAEQALHENQALLHAILEGTPDPIFLKDRSSRMLLANPATLAVIGKPAERVIGKNDAEFYDDPAAGRAIIENDRRVMETGQTEIIEERVVANGQDRIFLSTKTPYRDPQGSVLGVIGIARDITDRKQREANLHKLNRTLVALGKSSQAMIRAENEAGYLEQVCKIITQDCGYTLVWIGFAEQDESKSVRPAAYAGFEAGYLETLQITWADTERGRGPTGTAIRTGLPCMCRNMLTDPKFKPWREEALKRGYASSIVLPLLDESQAFGALTIYSKEPDPFSEDEVRLLSELANDLAYGITAIRLRAARAQVEAALRESEKRYHNLFTGMTEGFALHEIVCNADGVPCDYRFLDVNPAFERLTGLKQADVKGKLKCEVEQLRDDDPKWIEIYGKVALTGEPVHFENYSPPLQAYYDVFAYRPAPGQFAVIFQNITRRKQVEAERDRVEQALRESQERFEMVIQSSPISVYTTDRELRYNWIYNPRPGFRVEAMLGKTDEDLLPWDQVHELIALKRQVLESGVGARKVIQTRVSGQLEYQDVAAQPQRDREGKIVGLTVTAVDVTGIYQLQQEMQEKNARLEVQHLLIDQTEKERQRISRDLHDGPLQDLIGMTFELQTAIQDAPNLEEKQILIAVKESIQKQIGNLRTFTADLRPPTLANFGLEKAILSYLDTFREKHPEIRIYFDAEQNSGLTTEPIREILYRIFREAMNNIIRHAGATRIQIRLVKDAKNIELTLRDNGRGFEVSTDWIGLARNGHFGLVGIQERTEAVNGSVEILSEPGQGTTVRILIPSPEAPPA
jgi:PAS domain S-box-containing protein